MSNKNKIILILPVLFSIAILSCSAGVKRPRYQTNIWYNSPNWLSNKRIICAKYVDHYKLYYGLLANISKGTAQRFKSETQIVSMNIDGTDEKIIKNIVMVIKDIDKAISSEKYFIGTIKYIDYNPIKKLIAFSELVDRLYLMNEDGTNLKEIAELANRPFFSPDGKFLQYTSKNNVWLYDLDTGEHKILIENGIGGPWSPDGKNIAFSRKVDYQHDVFIYDLETKQEIYPEELNKEGIYSFEDWSPDGQMFAAPGIYSITGEYLKVPNIPSNARWSFDGRHIIGGATKEGYIAIVDSDGSNYKVLR